MPVSILTQLRARPTKDAPFLFAPRMRSCCSKRSSDIETRAATPCTASPLCRSIFICWSLRRPGNPSSDARNALRADSLLPFENNSQVKFGSPVSMSIGFGMRRIFKISWLILHGIPSGEISASTGSCIRNGRIGSMRCRSISGREGGRKGIPQGLKACPFGQPGVRAKARTYHLNPPSTGPSRYA